MLKISVSQLMGILKGKTAIKIFKSYPQLKKSHIGAIIFGQEDIVLTRLVLTKIRSRSMSYIKKNKNV